MFSPHIKFFEKTKRCLKLISLHHFLYVFWRIIFILLYSINWSNFVAWLSLLSEILGNMRIVIACYTGCDGINFENNLIFLIKPFFLYSQKVKLKTSWEQKELLTWNKVFLVFFKELSLKQIKPFFLEIKSHKIQIATIKN